MLMVTLEIAVSKTMTRVPKVCCREFHSVAELDGGEGDRDGSVARESSCQTALSMSEMEVVSSLAQVMHSEHEHATHLVMRGGGSPYSPSSSERLTTQLYANTPGVTKITRHPSPAKMSKAKWNSDVRCSWPPSSPQRSAKRPSDSKFKDVGVMTFSAISAGELIKKVEVLQLELDVHVGNERQLLSVNEQLRKRLEVCLRELSDAGTMNTQLENLNDEAEKILQLLRHLSERNAVLEKENALAQAKLQIEATLNKFKASKILRGGCEDYDYHDLGVRDAECQTICSCQQVVDKEKKRGDRKRWSKEEESNSSQPRSKSLSPTQIRYAEDISPQPFDKIPFSLLPSTNLFM